MKKFAILEMYIRWKSLEKLSPRKKVGGREGRKKRNKRKRGRA